MYIERLIISNSTGEIRNIPFHKGINLIVDNTPSKEDTKTGNGVGKTTVLKLIDFCLGSDAKNIYTNEENVVYEEVKDYLINNEILITLILTSDFSEISNKITIKRNFLSGKKKLLTVNDEAVSEDKKTKGKELLDTKLKGLIFNNIDEKPTFKQIKSHNIRYSEPSLSNTLSTLNKFTTLEEYETLYLFLLGLDFSDGETKQRLNATMKQEIAFKARLESKETKTGYVSVLSQLNKEIDELEAVKSSFHLNENFNNDLNLLNNIKREVRHKSSLLTSLNIKKDIIIEAKTDLKNEASNIDMQQLKIIYQQATNKIDNIQKSFEELVYFHNNMLHEKIDFISKDLPSIESDINLINDEIDKLRTLEQEKTDELAKSISFQDLEILISKINEKYRKKGEYEGIIEQITIIETSIENTQKAIDNINKNIFTEEFQDLLQKQINKFNTKFSLVSKELYDENFTIKFDEVESSKTKKPVYKFSPTFTSNQSTGKKQGEIVCFDIGYILFAEENNIPHLNFLLNDRKELMHGNQLLNITNFIKNKNIQFIASILEDKLPTGLKNKKYYIVELSEEDKLFRIE